MFHGCLADTFGRRPTYKDRVFQYNGTRFSRVGAKDPHRNIRVCVGPRGPWAIWRFTIRSNSQCQTVGGRQGGHRNNRGCGARRCRQERAIAPYTGEEGGMGQREESKVDTIKKIRKSTMHPPSGEEPIQALENARALLRRNSTEHTTIAQGSGRMGGE